MISKVDVNLRLLLTDYCWTPSVLNARCCILTGQQYILKIINTVIYNILISFSVFFSLKYLFNSWLFLIPLCGALFRIDVYHLYVDRLFWRRHDKHVAFRRNPFAVYFHVKLICFPYHAVVDRSSVTPMWCTYRVEKIC